MFYVYQHRIEGIKYVFNESRHNHFKKLLGLKRLNLIYIVTEYATESEANKAAGVI